MGRAAGVDHIVISASDFARSKRFYSRLLDLLGMKVFGTEDGAMGWKNGNTRYWIMEADANGRKHRHRIGNVGLHHYALSLRSRNDIDDLQVC